MSINTLSSAQQKAVLSKVKETCVIAGAGSGKTRLLIERFMYLVEKQKVHPSHIIAITFTKKAADEMITRLMHEFSERGLQDWIPSLHGGAIATIHSFALKLIKENAIDIGLDPEVRVIEDDEFRLLQRDVWGNLLDQTLFLEKKDYSSLLSFASLDQLYDSILACYSEWRSNLKDIHKPEGLVEGFFYELFMGFSERMEIEKRRRSVIDMDDQILLAHRLSQSTLFNHLIRARYHTLMVDEFQDINPMQYQFLQNLGRDLRCFYVGDTRQSIYGFRHADPSLYIRYMENADGKQRMSMPLDENYRSHPHIIQWANAFFSNQEQIKGKVFGDLKPMNSANNEQGTIEVLKFKKSTEETLGANERRRKEADGLADRIQDLVESGAASFSDIAILLQKRTGLQEYENALRRRNIPYHVVKGRGFYFKPEIMDVLNCLEAISKPDDELALASVFKSPLSGISDDALYCLFQSKDASLWQYVKTPFVIPAIEKQDLEAIHDTVQWIQHCHTHKNEYSLKDIIQYILDRTHYESIVLGSEDGDRRYLNLQKLKKKAKDYDRRGEGSMDGFVQYIKELMDDERIEEAEASVSGEKSDVVRVMTVHASKGLEFPIVCLADMDSSVTRMTKAPMFVLGRDSRIISKSDSKKKNTDYGLYVQNLKDKAIEETRRLFYVAVTRAKSLLILCDSQSLNIKRSDSHVSWNTLMYAAMPELATIRESTTWLWQSLPIKVHCVSPDAAKVVKQAPVKDENLENSVLSEQSANDVTACLKKQFENHQRPYFQTIDFTVSQMAEFMLRGDRPREDDDAFYSVDEGYLLSPSQYGTLFHEILQNIDYLKPIESEVSRLMSYFEYRMDKTIADHIREATMQYLNHPQTECIRQSMRSGHRIYRELPFVYRIQYQDKTLGYLKGQIDLLYHDAKMGWVLIDYKTGNNMTDEHQLQMQIYCYGMNSLLGESINEAMLYYSNSNVFKPVDLSSIETARFENTLSEQYEALKDLMICESSERGQS